MHLYAPALPLREHPGISVSQEPKALALLGEAGITKLGEMYQGGSFVALEDLTAKTAYSAILGFTCARLRAAVRAEYPAEPLMLKALQMLLTGSSRRALITRLYRTSLVENLLVISGAYDKWIAQLDEPLSWEDWMTCTLSGRLMANCNLLIIHFKFLHQMYYTPARLYRYGLWEDSHCARCGMENAGFKHLAWECPHVSRFWGSVTLHLTKILMESVPCPPLLCLLGCCTALKECNRRLPAVSLLLAKRVVAKCWGVELHLLLSLGLKILHIARSN